MYSCTRLYIRRHPEIGLYELLHTKFHINNQLIDEFDEKYPSEINVKLIDVKLIKNLIKLYSVVILATKTKYILTSSYTRVVYA